MYQHAKNQFIPPAHSTNKSNFGFFKHRHQIPQTQF